MPNPIPNQNLPPQQSKQATPQLPGVGVFSYKGGVGKTAMAVALSERFAWAGLQVLLITADSQEDARARLGVQPSAAKMVKVPLGSGSVTVLGARGSVAIEVLYRRGPEQLGFGKFDIAVIDTPPEQTGGHLPGLFLIGMVDGTDAARNMVTTLRGVPSNSEVILVKFEKQDPKDWAKDVEAIAKASKFEGKITLIGEPIVRSRPIKAALDSGTSVWAIPRRGNALTFLTCVDSLAVYVWNQVTGQPLPPIPSLKASSVYVPGWDDPDDS